MMTKFLFIVFLIFVSSCSFSQDKAILRGASEFRKTVLNHYLVNFQQVEKIRQKLDSLGVDNQDFERFCYHLNYISKNLYTGELAGRQYMVDMLKSNKAYKSLSEKELAIVIDNFEFIFLSKFGIWRERYPHKMDANSLRLKELSQYAINEGDRVLHFSAMKNHACEIMFLSYDSVQITHNPFKFEFKGSKIFDTISSERPNSSSSLVYLFDEFPKPIDNPLYDKVIFDCLGILFFRIYPNFKKKLNTIHELLAPDGELIVGANYQTLAFDGPFPEIGEIDKKISRILERGFELKERLYSENEYVVYKFRKVEK